MELILAIEEEIKKRLADKISWRERDSFRLFHGRGKGYPGAENCVIDIYYPVILITAFEDYSSDVQQALKKLLLSECSGLGISAILYQHRKGSGVENRILYGALPEAFFAKYKDLTFSLSFTQQNLGFFLDIAPAREWLSRHCQGARVLNLFSYTCAFSVVAAKHGAQSVVNFDMSGKSLGVGRENHRLNGLATDNVHFFPHDIFKSWGKIKRFGPYDIVIIDPPSMQKGSFIESKDYQRVWSKMSAITEPGAKILSCLNAPLVKKSAFRQRAEQGLPEFSLEQELDISEDFPERDPEMGLKMLVFNRP